MTPERSEADNRSRSVAKSIGRIVANAFDCSASDAMALFDQTESELLAEIDNEAEAIEVRRRIAEAKVSILAEKRESTAEEFESNWRALEILGFSNLEREASMLFCRAQFSIQHSAGENYAAYALKRLQDVIERLEKSEEIRLVEHFRKVHDRLSGDFKRAYGDIP